MPKNSLWSTLLAFLASAIRPCSISGVRINADPLSTLMFSWQGSLSFPTTLLSTSTEVWHVFFNPAGSVSALSTWYRTSFWLSSDGILTLTILLSPCNELRFVSDKSWLVSATLPYTLKESKKYHILNENRMILTIIPCWDFIIALKKVKHECVDRCFTQFTRHFVVKPHFHKNLFIEILVVTSCKYTYVSNYLIPQYRTLCAT